MNNKKYHINPVTGVPTICRAEKGNCPYGGASGEENHFNTYSKAQKESQAIFEETYRRPSSRPVQDTNEIMREIEARRRVKGSTLEKLLKKDDYEITKFIRYTDDENIVMSVIQGEIYESSSWDFISVALQNPNISKILLNEALFDYPGEFDITTRRWLTLNRSLTHEELVSIIEKEGEDMSVRSIAFKNPNIDKEYVSNIIHNKTDLLEKLPYSMIIYSHHRNEKTEEVKETRNNKSISLIAPYSKVFKTWEDLYRSRIEEEASQESDS